MVGFRRRKKPISLTGPREAGRVSRARVIERIRKRRARRARR